MVDQNAGMCEGSKRIVSGAADLYTNSLGVVQPLAIELVDRSLFPSVSDECQGPHIPNGSRSKRGGR